jgi:anthranilate phosphoribosyltransferase
MSAFPSLQDVVDGVEFSREESGAFMRSVIDHELPDVQVAAYISLLRQRGETSEEFIGFLNVLFEKMRRVHFDGDTLIDTCGTGGDGLGTFNISTATAIVVAAGGVPVAKHGNRSVSSKSGSSDVLEAAGVPIVDDPEGLSRVLEKRGLAFLFAPYHHPALKSVAKLRRDLGIRTVFNFLGPQANPAPLTHQYVGVSNMDFFRKYGEIFERRELPAYVVHGRSGADEALPGGSFHLLKVTTDGQEELVIDPAEHGVDKFEISDFAGGTPEANAKLLWEILDGGGPAGIRQAVALNAGLAFELTDRADTIREGFRKALGILDAGEGAMLLKTYIEEVKK